MVRCVVLGAVLWAGVALAQQPPDDGAGGKERQGRHHGPPPEALAACQGRSAGASCSFTSPRGEEKGTCFSPDAEKPLACRPEGGRPPPGGER